MPLFDNPVLVYFVDVTGSLNLRLPKRSGQFVEMEMDASWVFRTCIRFCDGADSDSGFMILRAPRCSIPLHSIGAK